MKNRIISGLFCSFLGFMLIAIPQWIFPVCSSKLQIAGKDITVPMKCFWSARAEFGVGLAVITTSVMLLLFKSQHIRMGISLSIAVLAALSSALPTVLIGVCKTETMLCRAATLPSWQLISGILFIFALFNAVYLFKTGKHHQS